MTTEPRTAVRPLDADALLRAVAAHGLPGIDTDTDTMASAPGPDRWPALLRAVGRERLEGPLAALVASGTWSVTAAQQVEAYAALRKVMALALVLEHELLAADEVLTGAGIAFRVLKGTAAAHLDAPDPSDRSFGDIDLLVRGDDLATAIEVLTDHGGRRRYAEPRPGFDRHFSKGASLQFERNCEIDLHRTLAAGPFGLSIDLDELFEQVEPFALGDKVLPALDRPARFLHAGYHAVLGSARPRLVPLRDLVRTAPATDADLATVLDRARRWRGEAVIARAVAEAVDRLGWQPSTTLADWARAFEPRRRDRRWLAASAGDDRSYAAQAITGLEAVPGVRAKLSYARAIALPRQAATDRTTRWRRGVHSVLARTGRDERT